MISVICSVPYGNTTILRYYKDTLLVHTTLYNFPKMSNYATAGSGSIDKTRRSTLINYSKLFTKYLFDNLKQVIKFSPITRI